MSQLLLQLRGGSKARGLQHYEHSIVRGIRLTEIEAELGAELEILRQLYPDGVARFWGSTPTEQRNNAKARALRDRRIGDDVLFYADKTFFARARILHLFNNRAAAKRIWGTDDEGQTWEHIMALGDVEPFRRPVPAEPILDQLGLVVPLRSLTLVSAADYARIAPTLSSYGVKPRTRAATPQSRGVTRQGLFAALRQIIEASRGDDDHPGAAHLPLIALWAIGRIAAGEQRLVEWGDIRSSLGPILSRYGAASGPSTLERSLSPLRRTHIWEVVAVNRGWELDRSGFHGARKPNGVGPGAHANLDGFTSEATTLLNQPHVRARAVAMLSGALPPAIDRRTLLTEVGLAGYDSASGVMEPDETAEGDASEQGPARRKVVHVERIVRSTAVADRVKRMHEHRCQICGVQLATRHGFYSEAAHIQGLGRPHDGTDAEDNVLCLCPNHHVQFDSFAIYIDSDFVIRRTSDDRQCGTLRRLAGHAIRQDYLQHHRRFCGKED